jgi:CheY-like chemotaxis protein
MSGVRWTAREGEMAMTERPAPRRRARDHDVDVLVVDADPDLRTHIVDLLVCDGYRVGEARDEHGALERIRSKGVGVVVLDPGWSTSDGHHFLEKLKGIDSPPVVIWTEASALTMLVAAALEAGGWPRGRRLCGSGPSALQAPAPTTQE